MTTTERHGVLGGVAYVLNTTGRGVAKGLEATTNFFGSFGSFGSIGNTFEGAFDKMKGFSLPKITLPCSAASAARKRIKECEAIIQERYLEIGRQSASSEGDDEQRKNAIIKLIEDVREFEREISRLRGNLADMENREAAPARKACKRPAHKPMSQAQAQKELALAIRLAMDSGAFTDSSAKATFKKVAEDLLDDEPEVRILAASELGKMGGPGCVGVLVAAARLGDPDLTMEALNALSGTDDPAALELFKESTTHPKFGVRLISLRGVYKLAPEDEAGPVLIGSLTDEHPEVRRTVAAYLGWKDFPGAVPALLQCLRDEDANVRKSVVGALAALRDETSVPGLIQTLADDSLEIREKALEALRSITGKSVTFDLSATGAEQDRAIAVLLEQWAGHSIQNEAPASPVAPEAVAEPVMTVAEAKPVTEPAKPQAEPEPAAAVLAAEPAAFAPQEFGLPEPVEWDGAAPSGAAPAVDAESIKDLNKADLMALCEKLGIACDPKLSKAEVKKLLLGNA